MHCTLIFIYFIYFIHLLAITIFIRQLLNHIDFSMFNITQAMDEIHRLQCEHVVSTRLNSTGISLSHAYHLNAAHTNTLKRRVHEMRKKSRAD